MPFWPGTRCSGNTLGSTFLCCSISLHLKRTMGEAEERQWRLQDLSLQCQSPMTSVDMTSEETAGPFSAV